MPTCAPQVTVTLVMGFPGGLHAAIVFPPMQLPLKHAQATGLLFQKVFLVVTSWPELSKVMVPPMTSMEDDEQTAPFCWMICMVQVDPGGLARVPTKPSPYTGMSQMSLLTHPSKLLRKGLVSTNV